MIEPTNASEIAAAFQKLNERISNNLPETTTSTVVPEGNNKDFGSTVTDALKSVNAAQMDSGNKKALYEMGADIPLTEVVMASQKASIALEASIQVRNKVLRAYEDIMNMPI